MNKLAHPLLTICGMILLATEFPASAQTPATPGATAAVPAAQPARRDPFWPVGFKPKNAQAAAVVAPKSPTRELSEEEMQQLIRREQDRIRELVAVNGKIVRGNKWFVFINQNLLVTEGHVLEVDVDGVMYKLVIKALSENNIQLEPYRQNKAKEPK